MVQNTSLATINNLPPNEKREVYIRLIPPELLQKFELNTNLFDDDSNDLLKLDAEADSTDTEIYLYHQNTYEDPILYGHLTDTISGQIHILLYTMNDPRSPRYNVDRMPDGTSTEFGIIQRNLVAEEKAMKAGLLPGQIRHGTRLMSKATDAFEKFVLSLGHTHYFAEPLYYHNAIIFERYGFKYQSGRRLMQSIQNGFQTGGELYNKLDGSLFRPKNAHDFIRLRSWAIHDGILGDHFSNVTMYKKIGDPGDFKYRPRYFLVGE